VCLAAAGCADVRAVSESSEDRRSFELSGTRLVVDSDGADLRLVPGDGDAVEVERSLTGKATADGNASWSLDGGTLRLSVTCSGFVPDCGGRHIVHVPGGVAVEVTSNGPVRAVGLSDDLTATVSGAWLRVEDPSGTLHLVAENNIDVTGASSPDVTATSRDSDVNLAFAGAPDRVEARANGSVTVILPSGPETYRVTARPGRRTLTSDLASARTVTATAGEGHTARVRKAS
jgi:hypothetical protein